MTKNVHPSQVAITGTQANAKSQTRWRTVYQYLMLFALGSFIGCLYETILCYFQFGYFASRQGMLYGPFNQVYGLGAVLIFALLRKKRQNLEIFLWGAFWGGIVEYLFSWGQETFFHSLSWDYSSYPLNFDGRTSIYHMLIWGLFSLVFMRFVCPWLEKVIFRVRENYWKPITIALALFFTINLTLSAVASLRYDQRQQNLPANNWFEEFLDYAYPDEFMDQVYANRRSPEEMIEQSAF